MSNVRKIEKMDDGSLSMSVKHGGSAAQSDLDLEQHSDDGDGYYAADLGATRTAIVASTLQQRGGHRQTLGQDVPCRRTVPAAVRITIIVERYLPRAGA